jgi:hypothetical protein
MVKREQWLSITPEPERELPWAVATLTSSGRPPESAVSAERERIERLVLRGNQSRWLAYLHRVVDLISVTPRRGDPEVEQARARAIAVITNHHNLLLALPGPGAARTAADRERLAQLRRCESEEYR